MSSYEVWSVASNELLGVIEVPRHVDHAPGAKVPIKVRGSIEHPKLGKFNAIEMRVCRMKTKERGVYWALETNLPLNIAMKLEGFVPRVMSPTLLETHRYGSTQVH